MSRDRTPTWVFNMAAKRKLNARENIHDGVEGPKAAVNEEEFFIDVRSLEYYVFELCSSP